MTKTHRTVCKNCGDVFQAERKDRIFCSKSCNAVYHRSPNRGNKSDALLTCDYCGSSFKRRVSYSRFCNIDCYSAYRNESAKRCYPTNGGYLRYSHNHPDPELRAQYVHVVVFRSAYPDAVCSACGGVYEHVHHKDENPQNNSLSNLEPLCASCHHRHHAIKNKLGHKSKEL